MVARSKAMTEENVYLVAEKHKNDIPKENYQEFVGYLRDSSDECVDGLMNMPLKKGKTSLLITIFAGLFGVDRFYLKDKKGGIFKIAMLVVAAIFATVGGILLGVTLADKEALATFTKELAVLEKLPATAEITAQIAALESKIAEINSSLSLTDTLSMIFLLIGGIILVIAIARWIMDITSAVSVTKTLNYRKLTSFVWKHELNEEGVPESFPSQL